LRLEEAKQILLLKNIAINEVAYQVGYQSPSQFSREFVKAFGISPKRFSMCNKI
jgi:AraC-like DNA-binding protein